MTRKVGLTSPGDFPSQVGGEVLKVSVAYSSAGGILQIFASNYSVQSSTITESGTSVMCPKARSCCQLFKARNRFPIG